MRKLALAIAFAALAGLVPASASADTFLTPYLGATFGGDAPSSRVTFGAAAGGMAGNVLGAEVDFGYTPKFTDLPSSGANGSVFTFMVNVLAGAPVGGFKPYVTAGVGLIRQGRQLTPSGVLNDVSSSDFGINVGGGARLSLSPHVSFRGDLRYFKVRKSGGLGFWRAYAGVALGG